MIKNNYYFIFLIIIFYKRKRNYLLAQYFINNDRKNIHLYNFEILLIDDSNYIFRLALLLTGENGQGQFVSFLGLGNG